MNGIKDLKSCSQEEMQELVLQLGQPKFRAAQLFDWMCKGAESFDDMKNVPAAFKTQLQNAGYFISYASVYRKWVSRIDKTVKYLFELHDKERVEAVVMQYKHGYSMCISTQAGCRMGCRFCASTIDGKQRDLTAGEMLSQIFAAQKDLNIRISNVVLMGMGEPLDNFDNTVRFLKLAGNEKGLHIGMRHISVSTCGLVEGIRRLKDLNLQITLSVSLHAADNATRDQIMPVNKKWPIEVLLQACREYIEVTGRRISFEYAVIKGVNDTPQDADKLADLLKGMLCHVNLIPVNPVKEEFVKPDRIYIEKFADRLKNKGINTTIRRTLGADIQASCGQLRAKDRTETAVL